MSKTITITITPSQLSGTAYNYVENGTLSLSGNDMSLDVPAYKTGKAYYSFGINFMQLFANQGYTIPTGAMSATWCKISSIHYTANVSTTALAAISQHPYMKCNRVQGSYGNWSSSSDIDASASTTFSKNLDHTLSSGSGYSFDQTFLFISIGFNIASNVQWSKRTYKLTNIKMVLTVEIYERPYRFYDGDGNVFASGNIECYKTPSNPTGTPTKTATAQYTYTFSSWTRPTEQQGLTADPWTATANFTSILRSYYIDLNGLLDGNVTGNISGYGLCDVYINDTLNSQNCTDFYQQFTYGTKFEIKNIRASVGKQYNGVAAGSISGTLTGTNSIQLNFTSIVYTITVNANPSEGGSTSGNITGTYGQTKTISASANIGYDFIKWSDNNVSNPRTITITDNATYTAIFQISPDFVNKIFVANKKTKGVYLGANSNIKIYVGATQIYGK